MTHEIEDDDAVLENPTCMHCGGPGICIGQLGKLWWFRCRNCGWEFFTSVDEGKRQ
jgi:hypothetical protein